MLTNLQSPRLAKSTPSIFLTRRLEIEQYATRSTVHANPKEQNNGISDINWNKYLSVLRQFPERSSRLVNVLAEFGVKEWNESLSLCSLLIKKSNFANRNWKKEYFLESKKAKCHQFHLFFPSDLKSYGIDRPSAIKALTSITDCQFFFILK